GTFMLLTYIGTDSRFFDAAFFDSNGNGSISIVGVPTATQIVLENSATGITTTLTGTGFVLAPDGAPISGTITGAIFAHNN
ncbi:hypothetical protein, partial [Anaerobacillus sp. 1_MG-2023]|uniref:hypothetical protein n=1 Tax=Anaerobacillus sp. 1_MG-2023 TaxID=3062655 RepID=UPI0026E46861